jgi:hypothetical protein
LAVTVTSGSIRRGVFQALLATTSALAAIILQRFGPAILYITLGYQSALQARAWMTRLAPRSWLTRFSRTRGQ